MRSAWSGLAVRFVVAAGVVLTATPAQAKVFCVNTAPAIVGAFVAAPFFEDPDIRIVAGSYSLSDSLSLKTIAFRVSGGWNEGCTQQTPNGLLTILEARGSEPLGVSLASQAVSEVDTLTFRGFAQGIVVHLKPSPSSSAPGATPPIFTQFKLRSSVFIRNGSVRVEVDGAPDCDDGTLVYFRDNVVALSTHPLLATEITNCKGRPIEVVHNTFVANPNRALGVFGVSQPILLNNAFSGNAQNYVWDYFKEPGKPRYCGNVGEAFTSVETNHDHAIDCPAQTNLAADPQLDALTFQPLPGSPAIDFGLTPEDFSDYRIEAVFPNFDLHGDARFTGPRPDAGAFETIGRCRP